MSPLIKLQVALALVAGVVTTAAAQEDHQHHANHSDERTESERGHIPPDPPQHQMGDMSDKEMAEMMDMDDTALFGMVAFDQFEWRDTEGDKSLFWDGRAWLGNDYDKALLKTEG